MKGSEIREQFLKYFEGKGHRRLPSAPLVPTDPTVLLTLAGMLQFKPIFLGIESPKQKRAVTAQKCIRMNDIDEVGRTTRHHTFFEMLGNFSFGDYFKKEAIELAWELLTKVFKLDKNDLVAAVFKDDDEAYGIWEKDIKLPKERIYRFGEENNFWAAGPTGPCGPCSEIYYDFGGGCGKPDCGPECGCERFLEIWNLVFIQYNRDENGVLTPLPKKNIDTGMGLERIARVLQGKQDNFETDLFAPLFKKLPDRSVSSKIVADHSRAMTYLIADSVLPSNEGRGYVLRRIIRRAVLHGRKLGLKSPFLPDLCKAVIDQGKSVYKELSEQEKIILLSVAKEEESFNAALGSGMKMLEEIFIKHEADKMLTGDEAFRLHDTHGFPCEVTQELASEKGYKVDREGFEKLMEEQRARARASAGKSSESILELKSVYEPKCGRTVFVGYDKAEAEAKVRAVVPDRRAVILDRTPFYPEGGGQIGDSGIIQDRIVTGAFGEIGGLIIHELDSVEGLKEGMKVKARIDESKRKGTEAHHTTTHLLHAALRSVLGEGARQAGSYVGPDRFRFDFSFSRGMTGQEIEKVEKIVNLNIQQAIPVEKTETSFKEAEKMGATALFSEKYGDRVRVVRIPGVSVELCGGCHVNNTSDIAFFKIIKEEALQAGVRRIEAISGQPAKVHIAYRSKGLNDQISELMRQHRILQAKKELLGGEKFLDSDIFEVEQTELDTLLKCVNEHDIDKVNRFIDHLQGRVDWLVERNRGINKEIEQLESKKALAGTDELMKDIKDIKGIKVIEEKLSEVSVDNMRIMADRLKDRMKSGIIILASTISDKVSFLVAVTDDLVEKGYHAGKLAKVLAETCGGGGGGRPNKAEAGGKDVSKVDEALVKALESL